jgi:hypothetical protein
MNQRIRSSVSESLLPGLLDTYVIDIHYFTLKRGRYKEGLGLYILLVALWAKFSIPAKSRDMGGVSTPSPPRPPMCHQFLKFKEIGHYG